MNPDSKSFAPKIVVLKWDCFLGDLLRHEISAIWPQATIEIYREGMPALISIQNKVPDLFITGARVCDMDGLEHLEPFLETSLPILVLLSKSDRRIVNLLRGVRYDGLYHTSTEGLANFATAIKKVIQGEAYISPACIPYLKAPRNITLDALTPMEELVLSVVGDGTTNEEASDRLGVSPLTIVSHRQKIMGKLKIHTTPQLMMYALREGYVRVTPEQTFRPGFQRRLSSKQANSHRRK